MSALTKLIAGKRVDLPIFSPTVFLHRKSWFWKLGSKSQILLMSFDVLGKSKLLSGSANIHRALDFDGVVILDNGAYGENVETDPKELFARQIRLRPDVAIVLDRPPANVASTVEQWRMVRQTIENARAIKPLRRPEGMWLEVVVHGVTDKQIEYCSTALSKLHFPIYGIPVSNFSKSRKYCDAANRALAVTKNLPRGCVLHFLGCGSRTMMALLSRFGPAIFDSSSYFMLAASGEQYKNVVMCTGEPDDSAECRFCQTRTVKGRTIAARVENNLIEINKEIVRIRCAKKRHQLQRYIHLRLGDRITTQLKKVIDDY